VDKTTTYDRARCRNVIIAYSRTFEIPFNKASNTCALYSTNSYLICQRVPTIIFLRKFRKYDLSCNGIENGVFFYTFIIPKARPKVRPLEANLM